ncbi:MAG: hypothetical protein KDD89_10190, partial [Anaerolineales bacterium]|nr:hypothetical protein [Anaerolineales bacterium]
MRKLTVVLMSLMGIVSTAVLLSVAGLAFAEPTEPTNDDYLTFEGTLDSFPQGLIGTWVVDGQSFVANASTEFDTEDGPFTVGECVKVDYLVVNGVNVAHEFDTEDDCQGDDDDNDVQTYGRVESFPDGLLGTWVVAGVSYTADNGTEFETEHGSFAVGACVEVKYDPATNRADEIETEDDYHCDGNNNGQPTNLRQTYGLVSSFPAGLIGEWVVDGVVYNTTAVSEFSEDDGPFIIGGCVEVKYDATTNLAYEIETEDDNCDNDDDDDSNNPERKAYGLLETRPQGSLLGTWVIGGQSYTADAQTEFDDDDSDGDFVNGVCVGVEYITTSGGNLARELEVEDRYKCQNGTAANRYSGQLDSFPASLYGVWVIDGLNFTTDTATEFDDDDQTYTIGECIKVKYITVAGINKVIELESDDDCDGNDDSGQTPNYNKLYATLDSFPAGLVGEWVIGGQSFTATARTEFDDDEDGDFAPGQCVSAEYDNGLVLHEVETEDSYKCNDNGNPTAVFKLYGTVSQLPAAPFIGNWLIGGQTIQVTASTVLQQEFGLFAPGAFVEVKYTLDGNTA